MSIGRQERVESVMAQLKSILGNYFFLPGFAWTDIIEILVLAFLMYEFALWIKRVRAGSVVKGLLLLLLFYAITKIFNMSALSWLMERTFSVGLIAIVVIFQPELRQVLERLGRTKMFYGIFGNRKEREERFTDQTIDAIVTAAYEMGAVKTGALIVIEQEIPLTDYETTGIAMDALISPQLLIQIFEHNTPLHDGAAIIRNNRLVSATCYLPLSNNMNISKDLGTRHRAALGISEETDSFTVVVSEETGDVSLAVGGELYRNIDRDSLRKKLAFIQKRTMDVKRFRLWKGKQRLNEQTQHEMEQNVAAEETAAEGTVSEETAAEGTAAEGTETVMADGKDMNS